MTAPSVDELHFLREAVRATDCLIAGIPRTHWRTPTVCEDMDVGRLVAHLAGGLEQFAGVPASSGLGPSSEAAPVAEEPSFEPDEGLAAYRAAGVRMLMAWSAPGVLDRSYPMPWGETPGSALVGFMVIEQVTHGWDLGRATGRPAPFGDALVEHTLELAQGFDDESIRVPGMFGPIVDIAPDAPAIDRLAVFLGRQP